MPAGPARLEFGAPNVAAHCGQAAMPRVTHDLFVRHVIAVGGRHKPGAQAMRADRFRQRALQSGPGSALEKDLTYGVRTQPGGFDHAAAIDLPEQRTLW